MPSAGAALAAGEVELGFTVSLASLPSRVSVTAPLGLPEVAGDPLNVGIVWDAENRLTEVRQGPTTLAAFTYDGFGRRAQKVAGGLVHTYAYDQRALIEERVNTGQTLRYVEGEAIDQHLAMQDGAAVTYFGTDHLGSVVQETNASGAVTLARRYDPWGNALTGGSSSGWAFTGREWDSETGLAYYRARYYDPRIGRFINEDPVGLSGGTNLFGYVDNAPVAGVDPLGLSKKYPPFKKRGCNPVELSVCEASCGTRGVELCEVQSFLHITRIVDKDGAVKILYEWKDATPNCVCNDDDDDEKFCRKNPGTCVLAVVLGVLVFLCTGPKMGPRMAPAPAGGAASTDPNGGT